MSKLSDAAIARAIAGGAGDGPGQTHVDDWLKQHPDPNDQGAASTLFGREQELNRPTGVSESGTGAGGQMLDARTAQAQLAQALKYDPNATLEKIGSNAQDYGQDANGGGEVALNNYVLHMDNSKIPKFMGDSIDPTKYGGWSPVDPFGKNQAELAKDPRYVIDDPNYGEYTFRGNLQANPNDAQDPLWKGIEMAAMAAGSMATGGASGLLFAGGNALASALDGGGYGGLEGVIMSALAGMTGIPGASSIMGLIMQQLQKQQSGGSNG